MNSGENTVYWRTIEFSALPINTPSHRFKQLQKKKFKKIIIYTKNYKMLTRFTQRAEFHIFFFLCEAYIPFLVMSEMT